MTEEASAKPDLSELVTVFVTTVGAPTFAACLDHLRHQDCDFALRVIDHVSPMNVAFQRMLDECQTPYYVQVDEDMLLYPHAVRTMVEKIEAGGENVALVSNDLFDVHLQFCILGVKIYRHAIVRRYPLAAMDAFETDQAQRIENDGYTILRSTPGPVPVAGSTLGLHGTRWTLPAIYERYVDLERRRHVYRRMPWVDRCGVEFLSRFRADPSDENFFALLGIVAGVLAARNGEGRAKDYHQSQSPPGFAALQQFLLDVAADGIAPLRVEDHEGADPPPTTARRRGTSAK